MDQQPTPRPIDLTEETSRKVTSLDRGSLRRLIGPWGLYAIGYGDVGSSIYYALGVTALYALGATPLALLIAGGVFLCTVLTYTELATTFPESGGSCTFARHAFNDFVSFVAGWALLLDYIVTIAISVYTVGPYLGHFFPALKTAAANVPFSFGLIGMLLALNIIGIKESVSIALTLCLFDIATQLAIVTIGGLAFFNLPTLAVLWQHMQIGVAGSDWSPTVGQFFKGIGMAMVAYIGIESISQLAGEARHPNRTIPKAMGRVTVTLVLVYLGVATIALSAIHPRDLTAKYLGDPIAGIVAALPVGGPWLSPWIALLGATILFVAANAGLVGASRLAYSMGEQFQLPNFFRRLNARFKTPQFALLFFGATACGVILGTAFMGEILHIDPLAAIADLYNIGAMLAFALAHLSLLSLRIRQPALERPFRIGANLRIGQWALPVTAIIGFLGTLAVWIDVVITKPAGRNLGMVWFAGGVAMYLYHRWRQHLPATQTLEVAHVKVPEFQQLAIKSILVPTRGGPQTETVQIASRIAKEYGAELTTLYVLEMPEALPLDTFLPDKLGEADAALDRAEAIAREYGIPFEKKLLQSRSAGETIVETAKEGQFDLIVMGAVMKPPLTLAPAATGFGKTVDYVLKNAPCRVWLCRS